MSFVAVGDSEPHQSSAAFSLILVETGYVLIQGRLSHATTSSPDLTSKVCLQLKVMILQVGMVGEL